MMSRRNNRSRIVSRILLLMTSVIAITFIGSCFVDVNFDIHDNEANVGDICEFVRDGVDAEEEEYVACDQDAEVPEPKYCDPREDGRVCKENDECSSNLCICDTCVDLL